MSWLNYVIKRRKEIRAEQAASDYNPAINYVGPRIKVRGKEITIPGPSSLPSGTCINYIAYKHDQNFKIPGKTKQDNKNFINSCLEATTLNGVMPDTFLYFVDCAYLWLLIYPALQIGGLIFARR